MSEEITESSAVDPPPGTFTILYRRALSAFLILFFVAIVSALANFVYILLLELSNPLPAWVTVGTGGVALLTLLKFLDKFWADYKNIWRSAAQSLAEFTKARKQFRSNNGLALFGLVFSAMLFSADKQDERTAPREPHRDLVLISIDTTEEQPIYETSRQYWARIPVLFERAAFNEDAVRVDALTVNRTDFEEGITYHAKGTELNDDLKSLGPVGNNYILRRVVNALAPCGSVDNFVELRIEGYASSMPFERRKIDAGQPYLHSDELNLITANERAETVKQELQELIDDYEAPIKITETKVWKDLDEMKEARGFNDRPRGQGLDQDAPPQDLLTRSAHIFVVDPGDCRISY